MALRCPSENGDSSAAERELLNRYMTQVAAVARKSEGTDFSK